MSLTLHTNVRLDDEPPLLAVTVTLYGLDREALLGSVPVISPVQLSRTRPGGSPIEVKLATPPSIAAAVMVRSTESPPKADCGPGSSMVVVAAMFIAGAGFPTFQTKVCWAS